MSEQPAENISGSDSFLALSRLEALKKASQLPDINEPAFVLVWDFLWRTSGEEQPIPLTIIRLGDLVVWTELTPYQAYHRFSHVCSLLSEKYGERLQDVSLTREARAWLSGDSKSAPESIHRTRERIQRRFHLAQSDRSLLETE